MNQTNQLRGESQHYKLWFEAKKKKVVENQTEIQRNIQDCELNDFNEGKNYNPMKHWEQHNQWRNIKLLIYSSNGEYMIIFYKNNIL